MNDYPVYDDDADAQAAQAWDRSAASRERQRCERAPAPRATPLPTAPAQAPACPEAAFSLCLRGTLDGHEAQLTVRGQSPEAFLAHLAVVRGLFDRSPAPPPSAPAPAQPTGEGWCAKHATQMTQNQKEGRSWWSHKTAEGWCKGK